MLGRALRSNQVQIPAVVRCYTIYGEDLPPRTTFLTMVVPVPDLAAQEPLPC